MSDAGIRTSVIVPAHNGGADLAACLTALVAASTSDSELLVVDDASTDDTAAVAAALGARLVRLARNSGPAAARNAGARDARGAVLFFVDADVVVGPGAIDRVARFFDEHPDVSAVFGSYDARPRAPGVVSRYRNLLHHFVHQQADPDASTFWAGCGAIRRAAFEALGGFDAERFPRSSIEDIELGDRLRRAGHRIRLDKGLQGTHLKRWTLGSLLRTDIGRRALPWSRLVLERGHTPAALNLAADQRLSAALVAAAGVSGALAVWRRPWLAVAAAALVGVIGLNRKLYAFLGRHGGWPFAGVCVVLHLLYYVYSGASYACAWLEFRMRGMAAALHKLPPGVRR
jgi:GT2 family glycosyltransferase